MSGYNKSTKKVHHRKRESFGEWIGWCSVVLGSRIVCVWNRLLMEVTLAPMCEEGGWMAALVIAGNTSQGCSGYGSLRTTALVAEDKTLWIFRGNIPERSRMRQFCSSYYFVLSMMFFTTRLRASLVTVLIAAVGSPISSLSTT